MTGLTDWQKVTAWLLSFSIKNGQLSSERLSDIKIVAPSIFTSARMRWVLAPSPGRFSLKCTDPMSSMLIGGDLGDGFVDSWPTNN